jgi:hypothetical protein
MVFLAGGVALEKFQGHLRALGDGEDWRIAESTVELAGRRRPGRGVGGAEGVERALGPTYLPGGF